MGRIIGWILVILFLLSISAGITACQGALTHSDIAIRALMDAGYTNISVEHKEVWFVAFEGGHGDDTVLYECRAKNPLGEEVNINVYVSWWPWQTATIRTR